MRKYGRVDANQAAIVKSLRQAGCSVLILSDVGGGCPDLLVGHGGFNYLLEVKDPSKKPSGRVLTDDERSFFRFWAGDKPTVVETPPEALFLCGAISAETYSGIRADRQRAAKTRAGRKGAATSRKAPGTLKSELRQS